MDYQAIIDKYYPAGTKCRGIFILHSRQVADKALEIARRCNLDIPHDIVEAAAMLHDIGIFLTKVRTILHTANANGLAVLHYSAHLFDWAEKIDQIGQIVHTHIIADATCRLPQEQILAQISVQTAIHIYLEGSDLSQIAAVHKLPCFLPGSAQEGVWCCT